MLLLMLLLLLQLLLLLLLLLQLLLLLRRGLGGCILESERLDNEKMVRGLLARPGEIRFWLISKGDQRDTIKNNLQKVVFKK